MAKLVLSPCARQDLQEIRSYIGGELLNPVAASRTLSKISKQIHRLAQHPKLGASLDMVIAIDSEYRFLICGKYIAFYRVETDGVYIDRILNGQRDYLKILFGHFPLEEEE